jgi:hypothetical protein
MLEFRFERLQSLLVLLLLLKKGLPRSLIVTNELGVYFV